MDDVEMERCVIFFRRGMKDQSGEAGPGGRITSERLPEPLRSAYEAGEKIAQQIQCGAEGHDDEARQWHRVDGKAGQYTHYESRECRACDRIKTTILASFNDVNEYNKYADGLVKQRREKEKNA